MGLKDEILGKGWRRLSDNSGSLGEHIGVALEAQPQDGSPSGPLSSRTDRPLLHAADQLFPEPLVCPRRAGGLGCPRHAQSAEPGRRCSGMIWPGRGVPLASLMGGCTPDAPFSMSLHDPRGELSALPWRGNGGHKGTGNRDGDCSAQSGLRKLRKPTRRVCVPAPGWLCWACDGHEKASEPTAWARAGACSPSAPQRCWTAAGADRRTLSPCRGRPDEELWVLP